MKLLIFIGFYITIMHNYQYVESIDFCSLHQYSNLKNSDYMQFTKEVISREYALLDNIKGLHCCAKGYRSIEWFKDGRPYPWPSEMSSLILYPEAANQTIYSRHIQLTDSGNYKCVLKNDTHVREHNIELQVTTNNPNLPLETYKPGDQEIDLDQQARFYCEAFVGKVNLPDAKNEIKWFKVLSDNKEEEAEGIQQQLERNTGQIIGSYLIIPSVKTHHYGRYFCRIQMSDDAHSLKMYTNLYGKSFTTSDDFTLLLALIAAVIACALTLSIWYCISVFLSKKSRTQCQSLINAEYGVQNEPRRV
ncbi:fibroblast growth factor receptor 3-like [Condylostylus longicornis]|uniref:fibroblast growth factor receptor 3-like n=1 Tax=Condylostylus longicornis TaxID=2530218 RepID=UPI00244E31AA|nr:fibroblast growth factor receptor 3-like [Condylostylus longicornis]